MDSVFSSPRYNAGDEAGSACAELLAVNKSIEQLDIWRMESHGNLRVPTPPMQRLPPRNKALLRDY